MTYYIADGNNRRGPFRLEELQAQGLRPDTLVWREGMADWQPASSVEEVRLLLQPAGGDPAAGAAPAVGAAPAGAPAWGQGYPQQPGYGQPGGYPQAPGYGQPGGYPGYPQQYGAMPSNVNGTKVAAGLCGIIVGALGVHKFVLGMNTAGVIMLLVSILSCGFAAPVMGIIGLIEGIIYLTKPDEEFYRLYMVEKKQWF